MKAIHKTMTKTKFEIGCQEQHWPQYDGGVQWHGPTALLNEVIVIRLLL